MADLKRPVVWTKLVDGKEIEENFTYFERITTVRGDCTGIGDFPIVYMRNHSGLPMDVDSSVQFTMHSKKTRCLQRWTRLWEFGDSLRFSYPTDHPLTWDLDEQMTTLIHEYVDQGEYLSPQALDVAGAHDDACMILALDCLGANRTGIGDILFL